MDSGYRPKVNVDIGGGSTDSGGGASKTNWMLQSY